VRRPAAAAHDGQARRGRLDGVLSAYQDALDFLFARTTGAFKFGLERTVALLAELGDPHHRLRIFHVAGTNGKGSSCATIEALLRARGLRVAKYTSPHLVDFRERIVVDGAPIAEDAVVEWLERWTPICLRVGASFFEATTAMAFDHFAHAGVDAAVIETGLGGRLDSTNVVSPLVAAVTTIGIDHAEYLGETRESIAGEKAGIFKPGVPAVIGEADPHIATLLAEHARRRGASRVVHVPEEYEVSDVALVAAGTRFTLARGAERPITLETPLVGRFQASNAALAIATLDAAGPEWRVDLEEARRALRTVALPGRFDRRDAWIFDVAHNPDGAAVLAATLGVVAPAVPVVALVAVLADKDWRGMISALAPRVSEFVFTCAPTAPANRLWEPDQALAFARERGWAARVERDFDRALALAPTLGATTLVTGSFHTVGDAMARLQLNPLPG